MQLPSTIESIGADAFNANGYLEKIVLDSQLVLDSLLADETSMGGIMSFAMTVYINKDLDADDTLALRSMYDFVKQSTSDKEGYYRYTAQQKS